MHQSVTVPDIDRRPVPTISLQAGDRWISVPAWWAEGAYRHGQALRPADIPAARAASIHAKLAMRRLRRSTMDTRIPNLTPAQLAEIEEVTTSGGEIPAWLELDAPEQAAADRAARGVILWLAAGAVASGLILAAWGIPGV